MADLQKTFDDIFGKTESWDAVGMAAPGHPVEAAPRPTTLDRLIETQKKFNDYLLDENKRLKSENAELRDALRQP